MKSAALTTPGNRIPVQGDSASLLSRTASARTALTTRWAQPIRLADSSLRCIPAMRALMSSRRMAPIGLTPIAGSM
jgi:hypothetical protein